MHEQLSWDVEELTRHGGLLDTLSGLLPEIVSVADVGTTTGHKVSGSPAPWHAEAADVLMTIHAGARELENAMRYRITGNARTRGGSDANTRDALAAVVKLAPALPEPIADDAAAQVARWVRQARQVRDIDQADRWVSLPRMPGMLPPPCPYCLTYALRMSRIAGEVRCLNVDCRDDNGRRPIARMQYGRLSGDGMLVFADGSLIVYDVPPAHEQAHQDAPTR